MFCFKCGAEIPDESEFCMKCGVKIPTCNGDKEDIENNSLYTSESLISSFGKNKIEAIKYVSHNSNISLSEAKKLVDELYKTSCNYEYQPPTSKIKKQKPLSKHQRIKENKKNGIACCPKCGSTSLSSGKQGFGIGKAVIGAGLVSNPIGLVAGNIHSKKVDVTCLNCGHKWKI